MKNFLKKFLVIALILSSTGIANADTINLLEQWKATTSPVRAITPTVPGKNIYAPYSTFTMDKLVVGTTTASSTFAGPIQFNGDIGSQNYFGFTPFYFNREDGSLTIASALDSGTGCHLRLIGIEASVQTFCVDFNGNASLYGSFTAANFIGSGLSTSTFAGGIQAAGLSSTKGLSVSGTGTSTINTNLLYGSNKNIELDGNLFTKNNTGITYLSINPSTYNTTLIGPSDGGDNIIFQVKSNVGASNVFTIRDGGLPGVPALSIGNYNFWPEVSNIADLGSGLLTFRAGYFGTKISVGTTSPTATFSVAAPSQSTPLVLMSTSTVGFATSTAFIIDSNGKIGVATSSPYLPFGVQGGMAASYYNADQSTATSTFAGGMLLAMQGGNIGIGTTTPVTKITVNGDVTVRGGAATAATVLSGLNGANSVQITLGSGVPTTGNSGAVLSKSANSASGTTGAYTSGSGNSSNSTSGAVDDRSGTGFNGTGAATYGSGNATNNGSGNTSLVTGNCSTTCGTLAVTGGDSGATAAGGSPVVVTSGNTGLSNGHGTQIILDPGCSGGSNTDNCGSVWFRLRKDAQFGLGTSTPGARLSIQGQINGLRQIMSVATTSLTSTSTTFTIDKNGLTILGMASTSSSTSAYFPAAAWLTIASSSRSQAQMQLDLGATPETPNDGQIWNATSTNSTETYTGYMWGTLRRRIFTATNDQTINTSAETTALASSYMGTSTIAANFPTVGTQLLITGEGVYSTPVGNVETVTVKVKYGATTLTTVTTAAFPASATNQPFRFYEKCTVRAVGASGSIICNGQLEYQTVISGTNVWVTNALDNAGAATTIDTTLKSDFNATVDWSQTAFTTQSIKVTQSSIDSN